MKRFALAREIMRAAARDHTLDLVGITSSSRSRWYVHARIDIARRLEADGFSAYIIGRLLNRDHTTVMYYLGHLRRKPLEEVMGPPRPPKLPVPPKVFIFKEKVVRSVAPEAKYLIPFAGAEVWRSA